MTEEYENIVKRCNIPPEKRARTDTIPTVQSSQPVPTASADTSEEKQENVVFKDDPEEKILAYGVEFHDSTYTNATQAGSMLGTFLTRPKKILEFPWQVGTDFTPFRFSPWDLFLADTRIQEKIATYKLLNATLHVKFLLNGSPFHYGRIFCGMRPTYFTNNTYNGTPATAVTCINYGIAGSEASTYPQKTFYSQRPHVLLNPSKNTPMEIHWPFFCSTDFIEVNDTDDYERLGFIECWVLNTLAHANGATDPVCVSVFAWLDNVDLSGITPYLQSSQPVRKKKTKKKTESQKNSVSEYEGEGIVSYPASVIENIASKLTKVPYIGKFAKATTIGAGAIKGIASLFGFSNPAILDKQCMMTQYQMGRMCQTAGNDPLVKLSLDPKNELTIDPSTVGLSGDDEMAFMKVAQREAFLDAFPWSTETAGTSKGLLYSVRVNPLVAPIEDAGDQIPGYFWLTPVALITTPFEYWTGSLVYRVQVVCSQMHRGRLGIVYTPDIAAFAGAVTDYNSLEHYSYIMDISQETDISFEVKWAQPQTWCTTQRDPAGTFDIMEQGTDATLGEYHRNANGRLDIFVVTDLVAPITDSTVEVNVYISAGDSFRVANPNSRIQTASYSDAGGNYDLGTTIPTLQMGLPMLQSSGAYTDQAQEDDPDQNTTYVINGDSPSDNSECLHVYMGEDIRSIRALIKRYVPYFPIAKMFTGTTGLGDIPSLLINMPNFPIGRAGGQYGSSGLDQSGGTANVWMTYLRWFAQAYVGFRGSLRYKLFTTMSINTYNNMYVFRQGDLQNDISRTNTTIAGTGATGAQYDALMGRTDADAYNNSDLGFMAGGFMQPTVNSNAMAYELPWYHFTRYGEIHANGNSYDAPDFDNGMYETHNLLFEGLIGGNNASNTNGYGRVYCAGGEDASFFFFIGAPAYKDLSPSFFVQ